MNTDTIIAPATQPSRNGKGKHPDEKPAHNPYLAARSEWNERYGSYIAEARRWKLIALAALAIAAVAVIGVLNLASKSRFVPFLVEVDKLGETLAIKKAEQAQAADTRVIRASLARFVDDTRSVTPDATLQKQALLEAYAYLSNQDPATAALNDHFAKNSPFERAQTETVTVEINNVLPITKDTWQIEWTESVRSRHGQPLEKTRWKATATVYVVPPVKEEQIMKNPLGIYIRDYTWAKQL